MATAPPRRAAPLSGAAARDEIAATLASVRERTLELIAPLSEQALNAVHDPILSPIAWDLGHIANFEEQWLVTAIGGRCALREDLGDVYDPFQAPRSERGELPFLRSDDCLAYMEASRERTLECLRDADLSPAGGMLLEGGFAYELVARHEMQHTETILQALQTMTSEAYSPPGRRQPPTARSRPGGMVAVAGGPVEIGAPESGFAYDNERPRHERDLPSFLIDVLPVTNGDFAQFVGDGGYARREWWSEDGWSWCEREAVTLPHYWQRDGESFCVRSFASVEPLDPARPVCHVSWYEADAYARYAGKRLPSEVEWEQAASSAAGEPKRLQPWGEGAFEGRANLDQLAFGAAPVGAYPDGASACGAQQLAGDVWEWTASGFDAYPGFEAFPYEEYSAPFFDGRFKVLRGGAWATRARAVTNTFRNWDYPERRQIFAGFRCACDAEGS